MEDHSFSQKYYTVLIEWIMAIPLWIDLFILCAVAVSLYLTIHNGVTCTAKYILTLGTITLGLTQRGLWQKL